MQALHPANRPLRFAALRIYTTHHGTAIDVLSDKHPSHQTDDQLLLNHKAVPIPPALIQQIKDLAIRIGQGITPTPITLPSTLRQLLAPILQQNIIPEAEQRRIRYALGQRFDQIPEGLRLWSGTWLPLKETANRAGFS